MENKKMLQKDFSKALLKKIKKNDIKQIPKVIFTFKYFSIWLFLILSILFGAISLGISFEYLVNADWILIKKLGFIKVVIIFLPVFWVLFLLVSVFLSYYNFKHTQKGYKYSIVKIIGLNIALSIILGIIFYISGFNNFIEGSMEYHMPKYRTILVEDRVSRMIKVWQNEEKGLLIGKINTLNNNSIDLVDYKNKKWIIILSDTTDVKPRVNLTIGERIKIMGKKIDTNRFKAVQIRPFIGRKIK